MRRASRPAICLKVISTPSVAAHGHDVLLVAVSRSRIHGVQILALLIAHTGQHAANGRTVHVHVKNAEEDADALPRAFGSGDSHRFGHQPVSGRDNQAGAGRNRPLGIAEKPKKNAASSTGAMLHAQLPVAHASTAATASKLKP